MALASARVKARLHKANVSVHAYVTAKGAAHVKKCAQLYSKRVPQFRFGIIGRRVAAGAFQQRRRLQDTGAARRIACGPPDVRVIWRLGSRDAGRELEFSAFPDPTDSPQHITVFCSMKPFSRHGLRARSDSICVLDWGTFL